MVYRDFSGLTPLALDFRKVTGILSVWELPAFRGRSVAAPTWGSGLNCMAGGGGGRGHCCQLLSTGQGWWDQQPAALTAPSLTPQVFDGLSLSLGPFWKLLISPMLSNVWGYDFLLLLYFVTSYFLGITKTSWSFYGTHSWFTVIIWIFFHLIWGDMTPLCTL